MAQIKIEVTLTVPDEKVVQFRDDMASALGWTQKDNGVGGPDPITKSSFVERFLKKELKQRLIEYKANTFAEQQRKIKLEEAKNEVT